MSDFKEITHFYVVKLCDLIEDTFIDKIVFSDDEGFQCVADLSQRSLLHWIDEISSQV